MPDSACSLKTDFHDKFHIRHHDSVLYISSSSSRESCLVVVKVFPVDPRSVLEFGDNVLFMAFDLWVHLFEFFSYQSFLRKGLKNKRLWKTPLTI